MEIKNNQITINIPEGMEIDIENSNFVNGVIKFKTKSLTYSDIYNNMRIFNRCSLSMAFDVSNKIDGLGKLSIIANYYNGNWKPNWETTDECKYCIVHDKNFNNPIDGYSVSPNFDIDYGSIYFKNEEDARSVINNSNFREILADIYEH